MDNRKIMGNAWQHEKLTTDSRQNSVQAHKKAVIENF